MTGGFEHGLGLQEVWAKVNGWGWLERSVSSGGYQSSRTTKKGYKHVTVFSSFLGALLTVKSLYRLPPLLYS